MAGRRCVDRQFSAVTISQRLNITSSVLKGASTLSVRRFSDVSSESEKKVEKKMGWLDRLFGPESNVAPESFQNRWLMVLPAFLTHMCLGSPWAWSLMTDVVSREQGFVVAAASDWTMMQAAFPLSLVFTFLGAAGTIAGSWQMKVGVRKSIAVASLAFGGGILLGAAGVHLHSLPLLYLGYGVLGGTGVGLAYTPPIQTLMQWFPDKKGIASGLCIAGFGPGALIFTPCVQYLMKKFAKMPTYLGPASDFSISNVDGKLFTNFNGSLVEVVNAGAAELAKIPYSLSEGLYMVGSGSTGAAAALSVMGVSYLSLMLLSSMAIKRPHPLWKPAGVENLPAAQSAPAVPDVSVDEAVRTRQFHQLGLTFFCIATGGMGIFSVAKPMMSEVFSALLPATVTAAFASKYLLMLSGANLGGRLGWAAISDKIGRRNTFLSFTLLAAPVYLAMPTVIEQVVSTGSNLPLYMFCGGTMVAISIMGGTYATLPAYESDLFGTKFVGPIHGRMMLYSSAASLAGPYLLIKLRSMSEKKAILDLIEKVSPEKFEAAFGATLDRANELLEAKTLTISKLLAIAPPGTLDPTPHIYDTTMMALGGLAAVALISHGTLRPLKPKTVVDVTATDKTPLQKH